MEANEKAKQGEELRLELEREAKLRLEVEQETEFLRTVRYRGMETGISEASKRVPIFSFATQGAKQVSSHFRQRNWVQPERLRSGLLQADLSLIV